MSRQRTRSTRLAWRLVYVSCTLGSKRPRTVVAGDPASGEKADARTRTGDPFITSEVLYQLSYVGETPTVAVSEASDPRRARR